MENHTWFFWNATLFCRRDALFGSISILLNFAITAIIVYFTKSLHSQMVGFQDRTSLDSNSLRALPDPHLTQLSVSLLWNSSISCGVNCVSLNRENCDDQFAGSFVSELCGWCKSGYYPPKDSIPGPSNTVCTASPDTTMDPSTSDCTALNRLDAISGSGKCGECLPGNTGESAPSRQKCLAVVCDHAPANCESLHRHPCTSSNIDNTCGVCFDGYHVYQSLAGSYSGGSSCDRECCLSLNSLLSHSFFKKKKIALIFIQ
jgi:hypothetical protein